MARRSANKSNAKEHQFRGVSRRLLGGRYVAQMYDRKNKCILFIGSYGTAKEAALAYDAKTREIHGSKAVTNFCSRQSAKVDMSASSHLKLQTHGSTDSSPKPMLGSGSGLINGDEQTTTFASCDSTVLSNNCADSSSTTMDMPFRGLDVDLNQLPPSEI
ncbi:hypothetical protein AQUCO_03300041v1 [Aquilegia coerulea]|uniref:AP2/ERF domain-containing protein n=1 Tax=Aquilegia coerulea TaxID=218851 RepID=A0A2G5CZ79_AQUCA|nr:hypothetical protein AQUCO_03300041v1 [Aquilegia coerulea]